MEAEIKNKIEKFITDNKLNFRGSGSDLNGNCVILAGFALFCDEDIDCEELIELVDTNAAEEMRRVFEFAEDNNYGDWWTSEAAIEQYKF
jgi:hypothetical protein